MPSAYLLLKVVHIAAVVAFLGNITTGLFWHRVAARNGEPKVFAFAMGGIIASDRWFTVPGVVLIIASGVGLALLGGYPLLRTGWILWTLLLFMASGVAFMARVAPLQRQLLALSSAGARGGTFDRAAYDALARRWELWGAVALGTPLIGLGLMVLKPI
jgi:uncharacterized membrane protein